MLAGWDKTQDLRQGEQKAPEQPSQPVEAKLVTDTEVLNRGADTIVAARVLGNVARNVREGRVPPLIEIKGLGSAVADIKRMMSDAKSEAAGLSQDGAQLVSAIKDVRAQVKQHFDDLKFEAEQLGNGGGGTSGNSGS